MNHYLDSSLKKLQRIWSDIGIGESQREERSKTVMLHLRNLLDEMVQEEDTLKNQIMSRIEKYKIEVTNLCEELNLPAYQENKFIFSFSFSLRYAPKGVLMLQTEKELRAKLDALSKEKHERLRTLKKLKDQDQHLCDVMCLTPYYIPTGTTPTAEQLQALELHVTSLKTEKVSY
ncbi:hypothetical protein KUTeg_004980 [Tegillarca granosa]|uniref:Uncharacterized protein n=1 Tax=Tegillarca granosa TaxID=220873 RepID=A0ABQ9FIF6_TEGGR|nr:hypothetical protein KUTeg_004980 [Tegillarca granosa]